MWTRRPSFLAWKEWLTVPFTQAGINESDRVVNVLLAIPALIANGEGGDAALQSKILQKPTSANGLDKLIGNILRNEKRNHRSITKGCEPWVDAPL